MKEKILNKIFLISIIIFIISLITFAYFFYLKPRPAAGLKINFIGPKEVLALENYDYQIQVENGSNQRLTNVSLKISLSQGAYNSERINEKEFSLFLGDLEPQKKYESKINLFFLNGGNEKETINLILSYKIGNKPNIFSKESIFSVLVKNTPIKAQIFLPAKIYLNQQFQANFTLINLTSKKLDNLKITVEPPSYFLLSSSFPKSENLTWFFSVLESKESKNISLIGQFQNIKTTGVFSLKIDFEFQGINFSLPKEIAKINVFENPVVFYINSNPSKESVQIGSNLFYEIILENRSKTSLENCEVKVTFEGPFDLQSLSSNGYYSQFEQALYWNPRNNENLLLLKPGDKAVFSFSISLFRSYPILGGENKNFTTKIRAEFRTPSVPIEIETPSKEYVVFQEDYKKIIGDLTIDQSLVYNDKYFLGEGPFPLQHNQPTTLTWHIYIKSIAEDFENLIISTKLPVGVNFTGKVGGDAILENLKYDPRTGSFLYVLNNIPANLGYTEKMIDLAFQIIVEPPGNIDINNFVIIPSLQYSAKGSFSQVQISKSLREIEASKILYQ
jgi:hypothetical protein